MKNFEVLQNIRKQSLARITLSLLFLGSTLLIYVGFTIASGVEVFSKDEQPFGIPYDSWLEKYWKWWIAVTPEQSAAPNGSCLINKTDSMVMLYQPANPGKHEFECDISSKDGL